MTGREFKIILMVHAVAATMTIIVLTLVIHALQ